MNCYYSYWSKEHHQFVITYPCFLGGSWEQGEIIRYPHIKFEARDLNDAEQIIKEVNEELRTSTRSDLYWTLFERSNYELMRRLGWR